MFEVLVSVALTAQTCSKKFPDVSSMITAGTRPRTAIAAEVAGRIVLPVVLAITMVRPRRRIASTPTIVVCAHGNSGANERYGNKRSGCRILILDHLWAIKSLNATSIQFFQNILLEYWILALQVCPTERRLIDRLRISVERFP